MSYLLKYGLADYNCHVMLLFSIQTHVVVVCSKSLFLYKDCPFSSEAFPIADLIRVLGYPLAPRFENNVFAALLYSF